MVERTAPPASASRWPRVGGELGAPQRTHRPRSSMVPIRQLAQYRMGSRIALPRPAVTALGASAHPRRGVGLSYPRRLRPRPCGGDSPPPVLLGTTRRTAEPVGILWPALE